MDIYTLLSEVFQRAVGDSPDLSLEKTKQLLRQRLEGKKFDAQDRALIEAILQDKNNSLEESFTQSLASYRDKPESEGKFSDFLNNEAGREEAVEIFLSVLERHIDYYYNILIAKHFAGS